MGPVGGDDRGGQPFAATRVGETDSAEGACFPQGAGVSSQGGNAQWKLGGGKVAFAYDERCAEGFVGGLLPGLGDCFQCLRQVKLVAPENGFDAGSEEDRELVCESRHIDKVQQSSGVLTAFAGWEGSRGFDTVRGRGVSAALFIPRVGKDLFSQPPGDTTELILTSCGGAQ